MADVAIDILGGAEGKGPKVDPVIHYVCVARGSVILTQYRANSKWRQDIPGLKDDVAATLARVDSKTQQTLASFSYTGADPDRALLLHLRVVEGLIFLTVTEAGFSKSVLGQYLSALSTAFRASFGSGQDVDHVKKGRLPGAYKKDVLVPRTDGINWDPNYAAGTHTKAKQAMQKVDAITEQLLDNVRELEKREVMLEDVQEQSEKLSEEAHLLHTNAVGLRKHLCCKAARATLFCWICGICTVVVVIGVVVAYITYGAVCNDWTLSKGCDDGPQNPFTNLTIPRNSVTSPTTFDAVYEQAPSASSEPSSPFSILKERENY